MSQKSSRGNVSVSVSQKFPIKQAQRGFECSLYVFTSFALNRFTSLNRSCWGMHLADFILKARLKVIKKCENNIFLFQGDAKHKWQLAVPWPYLQLFTLHFELVDLCTMWNTYWNIWRHSWQFNAMSRFIYFDFNCYLSLFTCIYLSTYVAPTWLLGYEWIREKVQD